MPYTITCTATITGTVESVWATWADMPAYPTWDAREEVTTLDGPFAAGTTGFSKQVGGRAGSTFTITSVEPMSRWSSVLPLPGGRLAIEHEIAPLPDGRLALTKTYVVHGPLALAFRLWFAREIRREVPASCAALEAEAARRVRA